jgi:Tol biopolymer transport system component/outer membrane biosynthesis protein TonB/predicted Ser/Thr protein kinase
MEQQTEDLTGKQLGPYHVVAIIGKGGMGVVYQAYEAKLSRYVALKVLSRRYADDPTFVKRFWQEAKAAANLEHPHILPVYAYGEHERYHYIAMQLVREGSLLNMLQGEPLELVQIGHITSQLSRALDYAHSQNVIHRDVKPDNILISRHSGCLLTDFGIAKLLEATTHLTQTGISLGTPAYMSPEQIRADANLDGRSDVYSLGVVVYEMATGRIPFQGKMQAIQMQHLNDPPPPPRELNPALPKRVEEVILKTLEKNPDARFATASEMAQALGAAMPEGLALGGAGGAAILGPTPSQVTEADRAAQAGEPIDSEELTAILEATSAMPSVEEKRRAPTEPVPALPSSRRLGRLPIVAAVAALALVALIVAGLVGVGGLGGRVLGGADAPTPVAVVGAGETETPTATRTRAPTQTPLPQPSATDIAEEPTLTPAPTATEEPEPTSANTPTRAPTQTSTRSATPTEAATATPEPEPSAMETRQAGPPPADLTGRLAIPLMYGNEPKVYIASTDGELETIVGGARQPDYSGDGSRLILNGSGGTWDKLRVTDPSGGAAFEIGDPGLAGHSFPSWSPDGSRVIYEDGTVDPKGSRIFVRDLNSNGPGSGAGDMLTVGIGQGELIGRNPVWASRDRFIFRGCNTWIPGMESECGLWLMQGDAGEPERLTNNASQVAMDVYGDTLVYVSPEAGDWNVYTLNLATGATQALTTDGAADGAATIAPDGRTVAFLSNRGGRLAVWTVGIRGGTPRKLFDLPAEWGGLRDDGWADEKLAWGPG